MSEGRLFQIIYYLLNKGEATAAELAEKFEVSIRTIYRDIDRLSGAGIPVYTTIGYKGGVRLDEDFVLKNSLLSKEDVQNIIMGIQSLSAIGFAQQDASLAKLQGLFQMQETGWMEVDYSRWGCDSEREKKSFGILKEAIRQKRQIHFEYYSACGEVSDRDCWPIKLVFKDRAWYLQAYCLKRNAKRLFRLSRIRQLMTTDRFFMEIPNESQSSTLPDVILPNGESSEATSPKAEASGTGSPETVSPKAEASRTGSPETVPPKAEASGTGSPETVSPKAESSSETVSSKAEASGTGSPETVSPKTESSSETVSSKTESSETMSSNAVRIMEMELCFAKGAAYRIYDVFDESMITEAGNSLIVKAAMPEDEWLYGFLMSFGDSLTILSPICLRDELIRRYQSALQHFMNIQNHTEEDSPIL